MSQTNISMFPTEDELKQTKLANNCNLYYKKWSKCFDSIQDAKHIPLNYCDPYINAWKKCKTISQ